MINLVALYGVGDCYLVCSLARAFERHHGVEAEVVVKSAHKFIPEWFGLRFLVDDTVVAAAESNVSGIWREHPNDVVDGRALYVHPHFVRTPTRLDQLTITPRVNQAAMYRALMQLPPDAPLQAPPPLDAGPDIPKMGWWDTVLITESRSWPNIGASFWDKLALGLIHSGRQLSVNEPDWSLEELLRRCVWAKEVIGPQCGVMSVLLEAGIGGHKTLCIRELGPDCPYLFGLTQTMPYGHCSTFAGNDHKNVDHVIVAPENWKEQVDFVVEGCRRGWLANGDI